MIDIVTISSKGQVVIPKKLRKEAGLNSQDRVLIMSDEGKIVLEKISKDEARRKMFDLIDYFTEKFEEKGITRADIEKEIQIVRRKNEKSSG